MLDELITSYCGEDAMIRIRDWVKAQNEKVAAAQAGTAMGRPDGAYYGAIGGAYTYMITPTSLGVVVKIKNGLTGDELDLTDYESW